MFIQFNRKYQRKNQYLNVFLKIPVSASSNVSPPSRRRLHRQAANTTPSSSSSRNESPRFTKEQENQYGVIKMKKSSARLNPNRNSASLQTSTLQEDLIKLIGKDFEHAGKTINSKLKVILLFLSSLVL